MHNDAATALDDYGAAGNTMTFTAVGFTTPKFWDDAALYVIALSQHGTGSYEYRAGGSLMPWPGSVIDGGAVVLDRNNGLEGTDTVTPGPTIGIEQAIVPHHVWARAGLAGLDETTWGGGMSAKVGPFKLDLAYLHDRARSRTLDVFGRKNVASLER